MNQKGKKPYESPSAKQVNIQQARSFILRHGREFLDLIFPSRRLENGNGPAQQPASYQPPRLTKLTPEQAKLKLLGHLSLGDQGAKDLLDLCFPEPGTTASDTPSPLVSMRMQKGAGALPPVTGSPARTIIHGGRNS